VDGTVITRGTFVVPLSFRQCFYGKLAVVVGNRRTGGTNSVITRGGVCAPKRTKVYSAGGFSTSVARFRIGRTFPGATLFVSRFLLFVPEDGRCRYETWSYRAYPAAAAEQRRELGRPYRDEIDNGGQPSVVYTNVNTSARAFNE